MAIQAFTNEVRVFFCYSCYREMVVDVDGEVLKEGYVVCPPDHAHWELCGKCFKNLFQQSRHYPLRR